MIARAGGRESDFDVAALRAPDPGHFCAFVIADDMASDHAAAELADRLLPDIPRRQALAGRTCLVDSGVARDLTLDLMQQLAIETHLTMRLQPGDIQLVHSHVVLYARSEYEDWPEPERKRHMLRLSLNTDLSFGASARPLTAEFAEAVQGIPRTMAQPSVPLDAV